MIAWRNCNSLLPWGVSDWQGLRANVIQAVAASTRQPCGCLVFYVPEIDFSAKAKEGESGLLNLAILTALART